MSKTIRNFPFKCGRSFPFDHRAHNSNVIHNLKFEDYDESNNEFDDISCERESQKQNQNWKKLFKIVETRNVKSFSELIEIVKNDIKLLELVNFYKTNICKWFDK